MSILNLSTKRNLTLVVFATFALRANAQDIKHAMITSLTGAVELFSPAGPSSTGNKVIFEGEKYESKKAAIGTKVLPKDVLRTGTNGKLKIIYDNGDVFLLGPATAFKVPHGNTGASESEVVYGKIRGVIDKEGPLHGVQIRTKSVVAGVRGTDLFVTYDPGSALAEVHVLRGVVTVKKNAFNGDSVKQDNAKTAGSNPNDATTSQEKEVVVSTGQKAVVQNAITKSDRENPKQETPATPEIKIEIKSSTQQDLKAIGQATTVAKVAAVNISSEEKNEIKRREDAATKLIIADIKAANPEAAKVIESKKIDSVEQANQLVVQDLSKLAPKGKNKPKRSDFESSGDVYKKFFKPSTE